MLDTKLATFAIRDSGTHLEERRINHPSVGDSDSWHLVGFSVAQPQSNTLLHQAPPSKLAPPLQPISLEFPHQSILDTTHRQIGVSLAPEFPIPTVCGPGQKIPSNKTQ